MKELTKWYLTIISAVLFYSISSYTLWFLINMTGTTIEMKILFKIGLIIMYGLLITLFSFDMVERWRMLKK